MSIAVNAMMTYRIILISKLRQTHPVEGASLPITFIQISIHLLINYTRWKLHSSWTSVDKHTVVFFLCVQTFLLFEEDKSGTSTERNSKYYQTSNESQDAVCNDEAKNGTANSASCPCDVTPLDAHELQRFLKSFEHWVTNVFVVFCSCCHSVYLRLNLV